MNANTLGVADRRIGTSGRRLAAALAGLLAAAAIAAAGPVDLASGHKTKVRTKVAFVSGSESGTHAVQVKSKKKKCFRNRPVSWYRERGDSDPIVYAGSTNSKGIAEPSQPFPAQAGDYVVVGPRFLGTPTAQHKHKCGKARTKPFPG